MRYDRTAMSPEAKVAHLDILLGKSNIIADVLSLTSLRSTGELIVLADGGRDILRNVAYEDAPAILKGPYESAPIIGQSPVEKAAEGIKTMDTFFVRQQEAELEMNLALVYAVLTHTKKEPLGEAAGRLIDRANRKLSSDNVYGGMVFDLRLGTILYLDAAFEVLGGRAQEDDEVQRFLGQAEKLLAKARDTSQGYNPYYQALTTFNLGRLELFRGSEPAIARQYLDDTHALAGQGRNEPLAKLTEHYLATIRDNARFGTIIDDPPEHKASLLGLVSQVLQPEQRRVRLR